MDDFFYVVSSHNLLKMFGDLYPKNDCSVHTLDYGTYRSRPDATMYILVGLAVFIVYNTLARRTSPYHYPPMQQVGTRISSMVAGVGNTISARTASAIGSSVIMDAGDSKTTSNVPKGVVSLVDCRACRMDANAWKAMLDAEKSKCDSAVRAFLEKHEKVAVLFYAPWCPHCHDAMPAFAKLASETKGTKFIMINAEALPRESFHGPNAIYQLKYFPTMAVKTSDDMREMSSMEELAAAVSASAEHSPAALEADTPIDEDGATEDLFKTLF